MMAKQYDIVIFGASGYSGRYIIEELSNSTEINSLKWAIAGRNVIKLKESLSYVQQYTMINLQNVPLIYADVENEITLNNMCKQTQVLLNCVGPYNLHGGEAVVAACIENCTHLIDISAELKYLETTQVKYFERAKEKNVYVIEASGFGSLPSDLGVCILKKNFPGVLNAVEYYVELGGKPEGRSAHVTTLLSGVHSVKDHFKSHKYDDMLKKIFKKSIPHSSYPLHQRLLLYSRKAKSLCCKYPGPDERVLMRTNKFCFEYLNEHPVQTAGYFQLPSFIETVLYAFLLAIIIPMSLFSAGQKLIEKYPEFFSAGKFTNAGPTRKQVKEGSFQISLFGTGWKEDSSHESKPNDKIKLTITGQDNGYFTTAKCMVEAALVVLKEKDKLPLRGGVLTPGAAFQHTSLQERLENRGLTFKIEK